MKQFYTIHRDETNAGYGRYSHAFMRVYDASDEYRSKDELFTLKWQTDPEIAGWYGFHLELDANSGRRALKQLNAARSTIARLEKAGINLGNPELVIEALGLERRVYDSRSSEHLKLEKVPPSNYRRFMARVEGQCILSVVAENSESAVALLTKEFAKHIAESSGYAYSYTSQFEKWLASGKTVEQDYNATSPTLSPLKDILKPLKVAKVEVAEAA